MIPLQPSLGPEEGKLLAGYIQSICGIQLDHTKHYLIENRLGSLLEQTKSASYRELYLKATSDSSGHIERAIIDAVTTGETSFFRDQAPFQLLGQKIVPDLIDRRLRAAWEKIPIRIWSAASSTGQEIYSIAIVLHQLLRGSEKYNIRLLGTDISPQATARASRGIYNEVEIGRGMPPDVLGRYFVKREGGWQICDEIRAMASFRTLNLLRDFSMLGQFDIIFCRNVAIYFSEQDKAALFARLAKSLAPDGYLIIGSTESLGTVAPIFESKRYLRSVFYQRVGTPASSARTP
jgi:chemotaxis protein methyltransferase CheR